MSARAAGISVASVTKHYSSPAGLVRAVDGISLEVEAGSSLAITGPSGCGKSTLLSLIGALEVPTSGRVVLGDEEISGLPASRRTELRRSELGLVFQSDNLLPFLTAVENVSQRLAMAGAPDGDARSYDLLARLGLADQAGKLPDQLSGGQRQRVAVARALVHQPRVILADEPTGSLDTGNAVAVVDLLLAAQQDLGATLVIVTHDLEVARRLRQHHSLRDGRSVDSDA
jgi:putative ABC transport system ATP-binding protein